jgi:vacuolar-type H+-ATPase subunit E/Vma4
MSNDIEKMLAHIKDKANFSKIASDLQVQLGKAKDAVVQTTEHVTDVVKAEVKADVALVEQVTPVVVEAIVEVKDAVVEAALTVGNISGDALKDLKSKIKK